MEDLLLACKKLAQHPTYTNAVKIAYALDQPNSSLKSLPVIRITVGGNCNTDFLLPGLRSGLLAAGFKGKITSTSYDNWMQAALNPKTRTDYWVIWLSAIGASRGGLERREMDFSGIQNALKAIESRGQKAIVILPEALRAEDDPYSPYVRWRWGALSKLDSVLPSFVVRFSAENLQRRFNHCHWHATRYWTMAKCPCHPDAATMVGLETAKVIVQITRPRVKAIVVDLDDTLWGGIVGDDGWGNLELDPDNTGRPYIEMQRFLKDQSEAGIPLCVVSKNDLTLAQEPFEKRSEMVLSKDDFVYFSASWDPKYLAIRKIAEALNIGFDAICFIDDSKIEREEAKYFIPELIIPDIGQDPEHRVAQLSDSGMFMTPFLRADDIARTRRYKEEVRRQDEFEAAVSYADYISSLKLKLLASPICAKNISRVASLIQKTNQFNFTLRRHGASEIMKLAECELNYAFCFSLTDKFGDYGIIAAVIGVKNGESVEIDSWVLSCRVFGRDVEQAIFEHLASWTIENDAYLFTSCYCKTKTNGLVAKFLNELGFERIDDAYELHVKNIKGPEHMIDILTE